MKDVIFGLIGVIVGSFLSWIQTWHSTKKEREKSAHYLAIRIVISLRQYIYKCWLVAVDDGLCLGERDSDGCLSPQAQDPGPISFPEDIDWKSIDANLAYKLLSLQPMAEAADRAIASSIEFSDGPPDYDEVFEERHYQYSKIGILVIELEAQVCNLFNLPSETHEQWNPKNDFERSINYVELRRARRADANIKMAKEMEILLKDRK